MGDKSPISKLVNAPPNYHQGAWVAVSYPKYMATRQHQAKHGFFKCSCCRRKADARIFLEVEKKKTGVILCMECWLYFDKQKHSITLVYPEGDLYSPAEQTLF